jgi:hypothetical protein
MKKSLMALALMAASMTVNAGFLEEVCLSPKLVENPVVALECASLMTEEWEGEALLPQESAYLIKTLWNPYEYSGFQWRAWNETFDILHVLNHAEELN